MTIQLENICKSVAGQKVLENVNWEIGSDDCFLLTGPEASGKTMLLRLILGLEKPDSGRVNLLGD
jgi:NitT/TauT family transport system ATP-binding protein